MSKELSKKFLWMRGCIADSFGLKEDQVSVLFRSLRTLSLATSPIDKRSNCSLRVKARQKSWPNTNIKSKASGDDWKRKNPKVIRRFRWVNHEIWEIFKHWTFGLQTNLCLERSLKFLEKVQKWNKEAMESKKKELRQLTNPYLQSIEAWLEKTNIEILVIALLHQKDITVEMKYQSVLD